MRSSTKKRSAQVDRLFACGALIAAALLMVYSTVGAAPAVDAPAAAVQAQPPLSSTVMLTGTKGAVVGQLINGTAGAALSQPATLMLYALAPDLETVMFTRTAPSDASGQARFEGLDAAPGVLYAVVVEYQHAFYFSEPQHFPSGQTTLTLPVTIYEATSDPGVIRVDRMHVILDLLPGSVQIGELIVASNTSDRAFIGSDGASLRVALPGEASDLAFQDGVLGGRYFLAGDGFVDTEAVRPGQQTHQILFSFVLPYNGKSLDVALPISYLVQNINVLLPDMGVQLDSAQLTPGGSRQTQNGNYWLFNSIESLAAGQVLSFRLTGAVKGAGSSAPLSTSPWVMAGAAAALAACVGVVLWWQSRRAGQDADAPDDQDELLDAIAALDDEYEAGRIAQEDYERERAALKAELARQMTLDE